MRRALLLLTIALQACARFHERAEHDDGDAPDAATLGRDSDILRDVGVDAATLGRDSDILRDVGVDAAIEVGSRTDAARVDAGTLTLDAWLAPRIYGEPCTRSQECAMGLTCETPFPSTPSVCADRCYSSRTRCEDDPDVLAWCEEAARCGAVYPRTEFQLCASDADCLPGLFCDDYCSRTPARVPGLCDAAWAAYWPAPPERTQEENERLFAQFETCMRDLERR